MKRANATTGGADSNSPDDNSGDGSGSGPGAGGALAWQEASGLLQGAASSLLRSGATGADPAQPPAAPRVAVVPAASMRRGNLGGETAIFKLWDILEGPEVATEVMTELQVYERLRSLQGCHVPKLLAAGTTLEGAVGFLTLSDCCEEVSDDSPLPQKLRIAMTEAVQAVHKHHVWHGNLHPRNFLHNRETDRIVLADFSVAQLLDGPHQALDDELAHFQRGAASASPEGRMTDINREMTDIAAKLRPEP
eukprot:jgi/Astpho2/1319/Aster-06191